MRQGRGDGGSERVVGRRVRKGRGGKCKKWEREKEGWEKY